MQSYKQALKKNEQNANCISASIPTSFKPVIRKVQTEPFCYEEGF